MKVRSQVISLRILIPHILVLFWIIFLGLTVWHHAIHSIQPPFFDSLDYFKKGLNFWQSISQGDWFNPLNLIPSARPPGTIILSAPCGYATDFHGFHFRSVFFPLLCIVISVYISVERKQRLVAGWGVATIAVLFSTLPMFYHFEWIADITSSVCFGLVDNFLAGVAALAAASFIRSLTLSSLRWLFVGALLASFTLFIKPSGGAIMVLLGGSWGFFVLCEWFVARQNFEEARKLRRYLILGLIQLFVVYIIFFTLCFKSQYLSIGHFLYARQALVIMKDVLAIPVSQLPLLLHVMMGEAVLFWIVGGISLFVYIWYYSDELKKWKLFKISGFLILAVTFWSVGVFYWLVIQAGGSQVRYFYPFFLMGLICLVPLGVHLWLQSSKWVRIIVMLVCFLSAGNMVLLLLQKNPPVSWQKATGVSVSIGMNDNVVKQAYSFFGKIRQEKHNIRMYSFLTGFPELIFADVGKYEGVIDPKYFNFTLRGPHDWVRGFLVRIDDLLLSEYICFAPSKDDDIQALMDLNQIPSYELENKVFHAWLSLLTEKDGIKIVSEGPVRLLEIIDFELFEISLEQFISSRTWRSQFREANLRRWWSESKLNSYLNANKDKKIVAKEVQFGDLYKLHVMTISHLGQKAKIEVWWQALREDEKFWERKIFFHFIDSAAQIRLQQYISLGGYNPPRQQPWRYGNIEFDPSIDGDITAFAFGVWHPDAKVGILKADRGVRDWDDRRVIVPLEKVMTYNEMESR